MRQLDAQFWREKQIFSTMTWSSTTTSSSRALAVGACYRICVFSRGCFRVVIVLACCLYRLNAVFTLRLRLGQFGNSVRGSISPVFENAETRDGNEELMPAFVLTDRSPYPLPCVLAAWQTGRLVPMRSSTIGRLDFTYKLP